MTVTAAGGRSGAGPATHERPPSWALLLPEGTVQLLLPRRRARRGLQGRLRDLPRGAPVALLDGRWGSRRRLRRTAAACGVAVTREYLLLPGLRSATFVVEDRPEPVAWLWGCVATVPPGLARSAPLVEVAVRAGRHLLPGAALGLVAPGRLVVGRRT